MTKHLRLTALLLVLAPGAGLAADLPADCSSAKPPAQPIEVSVLGTAFVPKSIKLSRSATMKSGDEAFENWRLVLRSEDSVMAPLGIEVSVAIRQGQSVDGKVFRRLPTKDMSKQPSVTGGLPEFQGWSYENREAGTRGAHVKYVASARLEFGTRQGDKIRGTLALCVPKGQKSTFDKTPTTADSYAIGAFEATLK